MTGIGAFSQPLAARRQALCTTCREETVQWICGYHTYSPRSYKGTRVTFYYTCTQCGEVNG